MGKYLIRVQSMDMDEKLGEQYTEGMEVDGFVIMADCGERDTVAIHRMNVDGISDIILHNDNLMSASILAKAKREIIQIAKREMTAGALGKLLGLE